MSELEALREIERAAGEMFRDIGMVEIANDEPLSVEVLAGYVSVGRAWVAVDSDAPVGGVVSSESGGEGDLVGYLIADLVDGCVHIEQVSVHPRHSRRGAGRRLIENAADYAVGIGSAALTLTTFTEVLWNAPYYRRCGFVAIEDAAITPGLRTVQEHEAAVGLDRWPRVCMMRRLDAVG